MQEETKQRIRLRIEQKLDSILTRRVASLEMDMRDIAQTNPFGSRLVPDEIWKGSKFERSFVTSFGQGVYEQIAYEIALGSGAHAENQHGEIVTLNTWQEEAINNLLSEQRGSATPQATNWQAELDRISSLDTPRRIDVATRFDLYVRRNDGSEEYYSLKTVKPNLDQTEIAKRDMLRISVAKPDCQAYLALPYNPCGEGNHYNWTMPNKMFNMNNSPAVLIGAGFWNAVGNDENTFFELLELFEEIGEEYRLRINNEYLDI